MIERWREISLAGGQGNLLGKEHGASHGEMWA